MAFTTSIRSRLIRSSLFATVAGGALFANCANGVTSAGPVPEDPGILHAPSTIALTGVHVVPMTSAHGLENQTVIIADGRILSIEPAGTTPVPAGATVIEGRGRFLMPALIDMHVHLRRAELPAYFRAGVTTVRNMWGHADVAAMKRGIADRTIIGPTVHSTSNGFDGNPPQWPYTKILLDPREADGAVQTAVNEGWMAVKVYQQLSLAVYDSIAVSAKRRAMDFVGHVPSVVPILHALDMGQRSIEHLSGYDFAVARRPSGGTFGWVDADETRFPELVRRTVEAGTWNCPTLAIYVHLAQQHPPNERAVIVATRRRFVAELARQGARLLVGTDTGIDVVTPSAIHEELSEFVAAGLTPYQALRGATIDAAAYLRVPGLGTVTAGAPAELLLLDGDPLANVANANRIAGLIARGTWYPARALQQLTSSRP
jgi:imidazolonepropionase-like amidohydrolase